MISFFVEGLAETKGSFVAIAPGILRADNPREKPWAELVGWTAKIAMRGKTIIAGRVSVEIYVTLPAPPNKTKKNRRDGDKLTRSILDAMTGIVFVDDELVDSHLCRKRIAKPGKKLGAAIYVEPMDAWPETDAGFEL